MGASVGSTFLDFSANKLEQLNGSIAACLGRLSYDQVWSRGSDAENAPGNLVLHLCGNVRQWIGTGLGGQPDIRERPKEFSAKGGPGAAELAESLAGVVAMAAGVLRGFPEARLTERVTIQSYNVTILEAVYHVVEHFSQHTGQIIYATKHATGENPDFYRHLNQPGDHGRTIP